MRGFSVSALIYCQKDGKKPQFLYFWSCRHVDEDGQRALNGYEVWEMKKYIIYKPVRM